MSEPYQKSEGERLAKRVARLVLIGGTARFVADDAPAPDTWPGLAPATVEAFRAGFARDPHATLKRFLALQCLGEPDRRGVQTRLGAALTPLDAPEQREKDSSPSAAPATGEPQTNPACAALLAWPSAPCRRARRGTCCWSARCPGEQHGRGPRGFMREWV